MPLEWISWDGSGGQDIHILRGRTGPDLRTRLRVYLDTGDMLANAVPAGITVSFSGNFSGAPAAHGVSMAASTGVVTAVTAPLPALRLRNFLVLVEVSDGTTTLREHLRVHIHETLTHVWITPGTMTVRSLATEVRPTVMGRFSDAVIGDITDWSSLPAGHASRLQWLSGTPASLTIDAQGVLVPTGNSGTHSVFVGVGAPPPGAPLSASTAVTLVPAWSTPVNLTLVPGAGPGDFIHLPNVLFLPDGFTDQATFEKFTRAIVDKLTSKQVARPFDLLRNQVNFWSAWVPSAQAGVSVRAELGAVVRTAGTNRRQTEVPFPSATNHTAPSWTLEEMIYQVGLPIPGDAGRALVAMQPDLQTLFGGLVTLGRTSSAFPDWLMLHQRTLVDERDTAFRSHTGERPTFTEHNSHRELLIRISTADLTAFLNNLTFAPHGKIGVTWGGGAGGPAGLTPGKDRGMVCVLGLTERSSGVNFVGRYFSSGTGTEEDHLITASPPPAERMALATPAVPPKPSLDTVGTVAHETAHSMTLDDEYGGESHIPAGYTYPQWANVQEEPPLRNAAGLFVPANIKWRWHRISHAGVTESLVSVLPGANNYRVQLRTGEGDKFKVGDRVRFRTRPLLSSTVSDPLEITAKTPQMIDLHLISGTFTHANYPIGSILMRPVRALAAPHEELRLLAPSIETFLTTQVHPLNAPNPVPIGRVCTPDDSQMLPATHIPLAIREQIRRKARPKFSAWLVGLYEGGSGFYCGIYHPTGTCLMRQNVISTDKGNLFDFCTVCRYAMIDLLDPSKHGVIDLDYDARYPDP